MDFCGGGRVAGGGVDGYGFLGGRWLDWGLLSRGSKG